MEFDANIFGFCFSTCVLSLLFYVVSFICILKNDKFLTNKFNKIKKDIDFLSDRLVEHDELLFDNYKDICDCQQKLDTLKTTYNTDFRLRNNQFERVYQDIRNVESKINKSKKKK